MDEYEPLPETTRIMTPSGGAHLYFAMPEGEPPLPIRQDWLQDVDIPWQVPVPPSAKLIKHALRSRDMSKPDDGRALPPVRVGAVS